MQFQRDLKNWLRSALFSKHGPKAPQEYLLVFFLFVCFCLLQNSVLGSVPLRGPLNSGKLRPPSTKSPARPVHNCSSSEHKRKSCSQLARAGRSFQGKGADPHSLLKAGMLAVGAILCLLGKRGHKALLWIRGPGGHAPDPFGHEALYDIIQMPVTSFGSVNLKEGLNSDQTPVRGARVISGCLVVAEELGRPREGVTEGAVYSPMKVLVIITIINSSRKDVPKQLFLMF